MKGGLAMLYLIKRLSRWQRRFLVEIVVLLALAMVSDALAGDSLEFLRVFLFEDAERLEDTFIAHRIEREDRDHDTADEEAETVDRVRNGHCAETAEDGVMGGLGAFLQNQLGGRSVVPREGDDPDAVLSRVGAAVEAGDLSTALTEIESLPEGEFLSAEKLGFFFR